MLSASKQNLFCQCVDLASQTGLFAAGSILMINMVCSSLVDRLASNRKEGFRFRADTGFLSGILGMALCVRFYAQDRCFDIWQVVHPLD